MGVQGWGGGGSGRVVLIDNGRVYQSKAADALVQVKTTKFGTNVGLNMLLNISSRYLGGLFWSRQLRGLPSSDGYFLAIRYEPINYLDSWFYSSASCCEPYMHIISFMLLLIVSIKLITFGWRPKLVDNSTLLWTENKLPELLTTDASHQIIKKNLVSTLVARLMGPTWGPSGADRTQVGPMLAPGTLLSGLRVPQLPFHLWLFQNWMNKYILFLDIMLK